jgi:hypothetical protein
MRKLNADPEFAAANAKRSSERMRKRHTDPEFAAANAERMRKLNADPEFAAANAKRMSERMRKLNADPVMKAKVGRRPLWCAPEDLPEYRALSVMLGRATAKAIILAGNAR